MFRRFLSLFVSIQVSDIYVKDLPIIVFFNLNFSFLDIFFFLKKFCSMKFILLAVLILSCKSIWCLLSSLIIRNYKEATCVSNKIIVYFQENVIISKGILEQVYVVNWPVCVTYHICAWQKEVCSLSDVYCVWTFDPLKRLQCMNLDVSLLRVLSIEILYW